MLGTPVGERVHDKTRTCGNTINSLCKERKLKLSMPAPQWLINERNFYHKFIQL
jgi:hypothetical protein